MDIFGILLLAFLGYQNGMRAKLKGMNPLLWGSITVVTYILAEAIGLMFVIVLFCRDIVDLNALSNRSIAFEEVSKKFNEQVLYAITSNPLRGITVFLFGLGGYLLIRYIMERRPNIPTTPTDNGAIM